MPSRKDGCSVDNRAHIFFLFLPSRLTPVAPPLRAALFQDLCEVTLMSPLPTGSAARTVMLADDEAAAYEALVSRLVKYFDPVGDNERALVQSIADTDWRLLRIPALEAGIYAVGRLEFAALYASEEDEAARRHLVDAKVFLAYQRPLNSLSMQEARLRRQREQDVKALREVQEIRRCERSTRLDKAAKAYIEAVYEDRNDEWEPGPNGFDFSIGEIELRAMDLDPHLFADYEKELADKMKEARSTPKQSRERERAGLPAFWPAN